MTHRHNPTVPLDDAHDRFLERVIDDTGGVCAWTVAS